MVADTGAQSDLPSLHANSPVVTLSALVYHAANGSLIPIDGAFFAKLTTTTCDGNEMLCHSMVYVSRSVRDMDLLYESLLNLGLLSSDFPLVKNTGRGTSLVRHMCHHPSMQRGPLMTTAVC